MSKEMLGGGIEKGRYRGGRFKMGDTEERCLQGEGGINRMGEEEEGGRKGRERGDRGKGY